MPQGLMGATQAPPFNLMQMILEGPQGYFGRRGQIEDQLWLQQQQQQQQGAAAQGLLATPEYQAMLKNPLDRATEFNFWAKSQGTPIASQGASWLQSALGAAYGREATTFEDGLARSRIVLGTDEAIRLEKTRQDMAQQQIQNKWKMLTGVDESGLTEPQKQGLRDARYNFLVQQGTGYRALPEGFSIAANGGMEPTIGGAKWQESMTQLEPLQRIGFNVDSLGKAMDDNTLTTAQAQSQIEQIRQDLRLANKMGALDSDASAAMQKFISDYGSMSGFGVSGAVPIVGSQQWLKAREQLRQLKIANDQGVESWHRTWNLPLNDPRVGNPYASVPGRPAPPKTSANDLPATQSQSVPASQQPSSMSNRGGGGPPANAPRAKSWWERQQEDFGKGGGASSKMGR